MKVRGHDKNTRSLHVWLEHEEPIINISYMLVPNINILLSVSTKISLGMVHKRYTIITLEL